MRLLYTTSDGKLGWTKDIIRSEKIPPYAILSHTWGEQEVVFDDLKSLDSVKDIDAKKEEGWNKIHFCAQQAKRDGLEYFWVDTCCIDKANNAELSEAINSMFRWYQNADKCYVFLSDMEGKSSNAKDRSSSRWKAAFGESRWFSRGWTLQELLAPRSVEFFSKDGARLGDKESLKQTIHEVTKIPIEALSGSNLSEYNAAERFYWAHDRQTTLEEDEAYCLLGIFGCCLPLIYGEGKERALKRLKREILDSSKEFASISANNTNIRDQSQKEKLSKILGWLSAPDPSTNYHRAKKQRQADTGLWFLQSARFEHWKESAASQLWLYGIPGCGKTILSSNIVEHLLQHCHDDTRKVTVYFYFDFKDKEKQIPELMLRSLLRQLLQRLVTVPETVDALFLSCESRKQQPSLHALLAIAPQVMRAFTHVYIVLDALDECTQRLELMDILETVARWQLDNVHLLMTSRKELDIEMSLMSYIGKDDVVGLQEDLVDMDILRYVQQRLRDDKGLAKWNKDAVIRQEIETALMHGARGMFRWADCQLDMLAKCRSLTTLRKSLATLPRTLDQTYDRILAAISEEDCVYAMRILQWLTFSARPLTIEEVAEVAAIDVARKPAFDRDEVPEDPLEVLEICSSLVTIRVDGVEALTGLPRRVVTLAHHSIQEYLVSDRIKQGAARRYRMEEIECHIAITKGCLGYLNQFQQPITEELFTLSALAQYSAEFWNDHFQKTGYRWDEVSPLVLSLCSTGNPAYLSWIRLHDPDGIEWGPNFERRLESIAPPLYYAASIGSTIISRLLLDQGADVDAQGGEYGNALQAASAKGHEGVVKRLIDAGADVNAMNEKLGNALQVASARGHKQVVRMLLDSSAGIDAHSGRYSNALQTVTEKGYSSIVRILPEYYDVTTGLMIAHTDSGYASQKQGNSLGPRSIQDPRFQQHLYSRADTSTQILSSCEVEADLDDIRSIESDHESIGSKILTDRSKAELFAVKYLASFIAQLEDLRSLHEVALEKIDRRRFTKNYRKILKSYYRRLLHEAANDTEKEVTKVLRSRQNRESIAEGIADHLQHVEEEEFRPLAGLVAQPTEKQYLENWLRRTQGVRYDPSNEATQEPDPEEYHPESSDDDNGLESDSEADSHDFLNVSRAEKFLKQGSAFRNLVLDIRLLMLPGHLREIIETTPKSSLQLLSKNDTTWVNRTKASLETYTGLERDWWPLAPRVPDLGIEEHNLQWKLYGRTLYTKILQDQADALREILRISGDHPSQCHCCVAKPRNASSVAFGSLLRPVFSWLENNRQRADGSGGAPSKAAMTYSLPPNGASGASSSTGPPTAGGASAPGVAPNNNGINSTTLTQASSLNMPSPTTPRAPTRIIFGIQGIRRSLEIEQVEISGLMNDQIFFSELKARYRKHRSFVGRFLSPFRFRYCNFVKFQKLNVNRVFSCGESLPEHDGFGHDYDYSPAHPKAKIPLIEPNIFARCLESCDQDCRWAVLGPRLHDCYQLSPFRGLGGRLKSIPKKKSEFAVQSQQKVDDVAWGIEADYALSFFLLSIYHLIPLLSCFAFWIYWQIFHPDDLQTASVPILTTIALMGLFWVPFIYVHGSKLRLGHG